MDLLADTPADAFDAQLGPERALDACIDVDGGDRSLSPSGSRPSAAGSWPRYAFATTGGRE
jgi:hypothetical protein